MKISSKQIIWIERSEVFCEISFLDKAIKILSIPAAKPTAGVGFPPNFSTNESYLPPPHIALWAPTSELTISK